MKSEWEARVAVGGLPVFLVLAVMLVGAGVWQHHNPCCRAEAAFW